MKRITAKFFVTDDGTEPVKEWLKSLDKTDRHTVGSDIATVEFGWPVGMPTCKPISCIWRLTLAGGSCVWR